MIVITPSLAIGSEGDVLEKDQFLAHTVNDAVHTIAEGAMAIIPVDGWEALATDVLNRLGATDEQVEWLITFAKGAPIREDELDAW